MDKIRYFRTTKTPQELDLFLGSQIHEGRFKGLKFNEEWLEEITPPSSLEELERDAAPFLRQYPTYTPESSFAFSELYRFWRFLKPLASAMLAEKEKTIALGKELHKNQQAAIERLQKEIEELEKHNKILLSQLHQAD